MFKKFKKWLSKNNKIKTTPTARVYAWEFGLAITKLDHISNLSTKEYNELIQKLKLKCVNSLFLIINSMVYPDPKQNKLIVLEKFDYWFVYYNNKLFKVKLNKQLQLYELKCVGVIK